MSQTPHTFALQGGLDLVTPPIVGVPGRVIGGKNYEPEVRGYRRMQGYERFDGRPKPSEATYWILDFKAGTVAITAGQTITATSGSGRVLVDAVVESGSFSGGDAKGYLVLVDVTGTFAVDDVLQVSSSNVATADSTAKEQAADTTALNDSYMQTAIEDRRGDILEIPGSGPVRGVASLNGVIYGFRNNTGGTALDMWKATTSGWVKQTFGQYLYFTAGTAAFSEGETITGGSSNATATIDRVAVYSGTYGGSDAKGYFILSSVSGTFTDGELVTSSSGSATVSGTNTALTIPAGGRVRSIVHNFYGGANSDRLYFVTGQGRAHEWDGSVLMFLHTGLSDALDKPTHIAEFSNHLFLGYQGGSLINSGTGLPASYAAIDGAGEIAFGRAFTELVKTSTALLVMSRDTVSYLVGSDINDFVLKPISEDSGCIENTLQVIGQPVFMDDIGLRNMKTVQAFGDWRLGAISALVEPYIRAKRDAGIAPQASVRVRSKDQYRLFFDDKSGFFTYFGRKNPEFLLFDLPFQVYCVESLEDSSGNEALFAGDNDSGMVYQLDAGNSFDGAVVNAFIQTSFVNQGLPRQEKRYHRAIVDVEALGEQSIAVAAEYSFGDPDQVSGAEQTLDVDGTGGFWDVALWDKFQWSVPINNTITVDLNGKGTNISLTFLSDHIYENPHTIATTTINWSPRRRQR